MKTTIKKLASLLAVSTLLTFGVVAPVTAATATDKSKTTTKSTVPSNADQSKTDTVDISGGVTQSYNAGPDVQLGMIVMLKDKDTSSVVPLQDSQIKNMLGVAVPGSNAAIVLSPTTVKAQQILIARSGDFNVLVSNQNGAVKKDDYLTISSVDGVAMKAGNEQEFLLGRATADFNGTSNVISTVQLKDALKNSINVAIGRIPATINITHNPSYQQKSDAVPAFLSKIATTIATKPVSAARIYLGLVILIITLVIVINVVQSGIRGGMIAVGRNPLSKKSIIKSLIQTIIGGMIIFITGVFAVYLLLKL